MANSAPPGRLLAFDLETTGLEPRRDAIVAIGCVPVEERTILWGRAYRALVDDPRSLRPRDLDALGTHQVLPGEQRGGLGLAELLDLVGEPARGGRRPPGARRQHRARLPRRGGARHGRPAARAAHALHAGLPARHRARPAASSPTGSPPARRAMRRSPPRSEPARTFFGLPAYPEHEPLFDALGTAELYLLLSHRFPGASSPRSELIEERNSSAARKERPS